MAVVVGPLMGAQLCRARIRTTPRCPLPTGRPQDPSETWHKATRLTIPEEG